MHVYMRSKIEIEFKLILFINNKYIFLFFIFLIIIYLMYTRKEIKI